MLIFRETLLPGYTFSHSRIHTHTHSEPVLPAGVGWRGRVEGVGCFLRDKK